MRFLQSVGFSPSCVLALVLAVAWAPGRGFAQQPLSPEAFFGHPIGADYHLTTYERAMDWLEHLADRSAGRMALLDMGLTEMGRPHRYAVISSAENMGRLGEYRETARRLSLAGRDDVRGDQGFREREILQEDEARRLAREGKAIAWIDVGLHSTEAAPSEHALQLAYDLVTGEDPRTRRIREEVITLLVFPNPDGMTMVADWYMEHVGTEFELSRMPWLYNRYVGHDNNRDSYNVTQEEVRNVSRLQNQEWFPNVVYNHHQTAPFPTRIWIPPYGEPTNPNKPGEVIRWENLIGAAMGMAFDAEGKPGAVSRVSFDAWYPGFMTQVVTHHNIPSILTETALHYLATPRQYTLSDIPAEWRGFDKSAFYSTPWRGGWWRIGDAVDYCLTASMAVLDVTSRYREEMLLSKYRLALANIQRFEVEGPFGWAFPEDQRDPLALAELLDKLEILGVEAYRATEAFQAGGRVLPAGTVVVPTSQPFGGFVKTLLERQDYPDLRTRTHLWQGIPRRVEVEGGPLRPYDVAGWTLPLQMGLEAVELEGPVSVLSLAPLQPPTPGPAVPIQPGTGEPGSAGGAILLEAGNGASWKVVNRLISRGVPVEREVGGDGSFRIPSGHGQAIEEVLRSLGSLPVSLGPEEENPGERRATHPLAPARIGLYRPWQANMDEGWLRWILEHYDFPVLEVLNDRIRAGSLRGDFDVLVLPSMGAAAILEGNDAGDVPPAYVGGIGREGVEALKAFAREGGTLVFHEGSVQLALQEFGLPLRDGSRGAQEGGFYSAGSILRFHWNGHSALTRGMDPDGVAFVTSRASLFEITGEGGGEVGSPEVLGSFPAEGPVLLSGYLEGEEAIRGKAAAVNVPYGQGRLVLVGFSLHNRAQTVANFKLLFNALMSPGA